MFNNILDVTTLVHLTIDKFSSEHEADGIPELQTSQIERFAEFERALNT